MQFDPRRPSFASGSCADEIQSSDPGAFCIAKLCQFDMIWIIRFQKASFPFENSIEFPRNGTTAWMRIWDTPTDHYGSAMEKYMPPHSLIFMAIFAIIFAVAALLIYYRFSRRVQQLEKEVAECRNRMRSTTAQCDELKDEIQRKNRELTFYKMNFAQRAEFMEGIKKDLIAIASAHPETTSRIQAITRSIHNSHNADREWLEFKTQFESIHHNFFSTLKQVCPDLSSADLKLCALLRLNMNMKEAANVLGISPESVKTARHRLRKKLRLSHDQNLLDFILSVEENSLATNDVALSA